MTEARLLRSTGITPLHRYYGPIRLPAAAALRVMYSPGAFPPTAGIWRGAFALPLSLLSSHATIRSHSAPLDAFSTDGFAAPGLPSFRTICRYAPSPATPGGPVGVCTHFYPTGIRLHLPVQVGRHRLV